MKKLSIGMVAALSLVAVTGCKKKGGAAGEAMAKMEEFSKAMCDCKDKACADKVNADMTKWGTEMAKTAGAAKDDKPDPEMAKKSADIMTKYTECMTKLMMAGAGGGDMKGGDMKGGDTAGAKPAGKSCEDQGGKKSGDVCELKAAPFDVAFTGKYDTSAMQPEPAAVFKITNKTDAPIKINTVKVYGYDKAGAQQEFDVGGNKVKYYEVSMGGMLELGPKESKDWVTKVEKKFVEKMDALQLEVTSWESGSDRYGRTGASEAGDFFEKRPKDGWK